MHTNHKSMPREIEIFEQKIINYSRSIRQDFAAKFLIDADTSGASFVYDTAILLLSFKEDDDQAVGTANNQASRMQFYPLSRFDSDFCEYLQDRSRFYAEAKQLVSDFPPHQGVSMQ